MSLPVHVREAAADADPKGDLLFALGWGNRPAHDPVDWLLSGLAADGWTVHAAELPENGTDFQAEYVRPLARVRDDVEPAVCAGHSLGGLTLAHLPGDDPRVYSAPFWGFETSGVADLVLPAVSALPVSSRVVPLGYDPRAIGELKPADEPSAAERGTSPAWLGAVRTAQRRLPAFREGSVVYCSLADRVVSPQSIGRHAPAAQLRLYDGGHEFFASSGRAETLARFCSDLDTTAELVG